MRLDAKYAKPAGGRRLHDLNRVREWAGVGDFSADGLRKKEVYVAEAEGRAMEWDAEPNAVGFYEKLGGRYLRDSEPSLWGRVIPVMGVDLADSPDR